MVRWSVIVAPLLIATALASCAVIADLPDYADRRGDGGPIADASRDAVTATDGPSDGPSPDAPDVADAADAAPLIDDLGCNGAAAAGLLGHWKLDEGTGTTVADCSPAGSNGTFGGMGTTWVKGRRGPFALRFDGNGHVGLGDPPGLHLTGAMTAMAWVDIQSFTTNGRIISKSGAPGNRGWDLNVEGTGVLSFRISTDGTTAVVAESGVLMTGGWRHVAGVFDPGSAVRLYIAGAQVAATTNGVPLLQRDGMQGVDIGRRQGDGCCPFQGSIDDVRVYGRVLSAAEIARIAAQ